MQWTQYFELFEGMFQQSKEIKQNKIIPKQIWSNKDTFFVGKCISIFKKLLKYSIIKKIISNHFLKNTGVEIVAGHWRMTVKSFCVLGKIW